MPSRCGAASCSTGSTTPKPGVDRMAGRRARRTHAALAGRHARAPGAARGVVTGRGALLRRTLLASDPFDEDAIVALLTAQQAAGDGDAVRADLPRLRRAPGRGARRRAVAARAHVAADAARGRALARRLRRARAASCKELAALLARDECRALTVTGPGGAGKSRLAKQALRTLAARFADGALWIALDDLTRMPQVAARLAAELRIAARRGRRSAGAGSASVLRRARCC